MPLVNTQQMLQDAQRDGYAVGAFNTENMEMTQAIIEAAVELRAPVIVQTTPSTVRYGSLALFYANTAALAAQAPVPVALHLDHGDSFSLVMQAIRAGYTSVMIDGSQLPFAENVELSARVAAAAQPCGVPVEAELGTVGGKEDETCGGTGGYTDPAEAREFVERSGISSLAVAIGTAHGLYSGTPVLDVARLREIRGLVSAPLVLHGASGLTDRQIQDCIAAGICKVNVATELRVAFTDGFRSVLRESPDTFDPKKPGAAGRDWVRSVVLERIRVCGADGRA